MSRRSRPAPAPRPCSAESGCRTSCRGSCPAPRWGSRGRSASSGRSSSSPATCRSRPRSPRCSSSGGSSRTRRRRPPRCRSCCWRYRCSCCSGSASSGASATTRRPPMVVDRRARIGLRVLALAYLAGLLLVPVAVVFYRTFEHGIGAVWDSVTTPAAMHAFWLTVEIALIAVPLNTVLGVVTALALVRGRFRGKWLLQAAIDLPFAISPVVIGLALVLVYGRTGWFGGWLADHGIRVIFAMPGMVLATIFVCLPFVAREVEAGPRG